LTETETDATPNGWYTDDKAVSDPTANRPGGRVFRIDRECYVVYVGSDDHRVRPFLRVGTSPSLPDRIRPYIGTVVLSDRLTGNPLDEATTVGSTTRRRPDYTGSPDVVHAYSPLTGMPTVEERPISRRGGAPREGAFVKFLTDGDLDLTVNGHRIYGLDERERGDSHRAYLIQRAATIVEETAAAYRRDIFSPPGFLVGTDRSFFRFSGSNLTAHALRPGALEALTGRLVDPRLLTRVAGPADPLELLVWLKWWLRRRLVSGDVTTISLAGAGPAAGGTGASRLVQLTDVARAAGLAVEWVPPQGDPQPPAPAVGEEPVVAREGGGDRVTAPPEILLPDGFQWLGGSAPVVIPGIPYRFHDSAHALEAEGLVADPAEFNLSRSDGYGTLLNLLHRFNDGGVPPGDGDAFVREVSRLLTECPAPVTVELVPNDHEYQPRFMVQRGFTIARSRENTRAVARMTEAVSTVDEESVYRDERRRLMELLDELLRESRATTKHVPSEDDSSPTDATSAATDAARETARGSDPQPASPQKDQSREDPQREAGTAGRGLDESGKPVSSSVSARDSSSSAGVGASPRPGSHSPSASTAGGGRHAAAVGSGTGAHPGRRRAGLLAAAAVAVIVLVFLLVRPFRSQPGVTDQAVSEDTPSVVTTEGGMDPAADAGSPDGDGGSATNPDAADGDRDSVAPSDQPAVRDDAGSEPAGAAGAIAGGGSVPAGDDDGATASVPPTAVPGDGDPATAPDDDVTDEAPSTAATITPETTTERVPATEEEGGANAIVISLSDMIRLVNRIARMNGYAPIGDFFPGARDPDWIFPGNVLTLPDESLYTIRDGDTMWGIADRFVQQSIPQERQALIDIERRILWGEIPSRSVEVREQLEALAEDALLESTRRSAEELLEE
jgi:hypothetical protein